MNPPPIFTSLKTFPDFWSNGIPAITYHKVGPRPWGARIRGLYLSPRLFRKQISELVAAQATFATPAAFLQANPSTKACVLTFDDGFANTHRHALPVLAEAKATAIQFIIADRIGRNNGWEIAQGEKPERLMDIAQIRDWLAAGLEIGAHTRTHPHLSQIHPRQAREEIFGSKRKLEDLFGRPIHHFCYPYGDYSPAIIDLVKEAGFLTAFSTRPTANPPATSRFELGRWTARHVSFRPFSRKK
jgi:peptidoglycan/xylan/chitin deacetylase (PgdA/CDA1 family)